jgi:hypothetical protein
MKLFWTHVGQTVSAGILLFALSGCAFADTFVASYLPAGVQTPAGITTNYETFNSQSVGTTLSSPFVTTFNGSPYVGTYTGSIVWSGANSYGGAGGNSAYPEVVTGTSYSLSINSSVNYFGLWFSALDPGNELQFYNNSTLLFTFTPAQFISLVGACPGGPFCGNPNAAFLGQDSGQQFAYLDFYDSDGAFNKIVFSEIGTTFAGLESDNQAVGVLATPPGGTIISSIPEPGTFALLGISGLALLLPLRRRA